MAEVRGNFIAGKMNKSVDERLVPEGEYVDALNVRLGSTESTEVGAVENSKGNTQLTFLQYLGNPLSSPAIPGGTETTFCLGTYEDGMQETIYWFIHDSFNFAASPLTGKVDMIVSFNANSNTVTYHVVCVNDGGGVNTTLNFDPKFLVTGVNKIEDLLFFTDDKNAPRVINVNRNYDDPVAGVDGIETEDINVIVKPPGFEDSVLGSIPLTAPKVEPTDIPGDENYMETRFLSFAYRYRYQDGGYSPTSLFSLPSFQPRGFRFDLDNFNNAGMVNRFNAANVTFSTGSKRVIQVDLLYKESTSNVIYVIERFNKKVQGWPDDGLQTMLFTNSKIFTTLGSDELLRQYDNVPRIAKAQTIQGNRLVYGNYVDGYDIEDANGQTIAINYSTEHIVEEIGGVGLLQPIGTTGINYMIGQPSTPDSIAFSKLTFDLTGLTEPILPGITFNFDVSIQSAPSTGPSPNPQGTGPDTDLGFQNTSPFSLQWVFTAQTTYATISDMVNSTEFQLPIGTTANANYQPLLPTDLSGQGGTLTDKFNNTIIAPPSTLLEKINSSITTSCSIAAPPLTAVCTQQGFNYTALATGFSIQCPAFRYYSSTEVVPATIPPTFVDSNQFEFFSFVDFQSTSGYLLTADTYSLHSNRDYETGIVYMDDYGRASTVLVSNNNTIYVPPIHSRDKNTIGVTLNNLPPYWATKYKFVVKPSEGEYFSVYSALYYESNDPSAFYFKLEGDNTNIVTQGMNLIVKADTLGPVNTNVVCTVLEVVGLSRNDSRVSGNVNLAGLYMLIKPGGFNTDLAPDAVINYGNASSSSNSTSCGLSKSYSLLLPDNSAPYDLPAGSTVRIRINNWRGSKGSNCTSKSYKFDQSFIVSQDYPNFYRWWYGDSVDLTTGSTNAMSAKQYLNNGVAPYASSNSVGSACFQTRMFCYGNETTTLRFQNRCGIRRCSSFWGDKRPGHVGTLIEVTRGGNLIVWETEPSEVDPNLFYDASEMMDVYTDPLDNRRYHKSSGGTNTDQSSTSANLKQTLSFANCFTFGNGVESFRITDSPATKSFQLGERVLAVSNQEYKEANRFAGLTYSGVFSGASNSNNLNEFNLGLVNYKDCETSFGPIQVLHSRETDILVLQEDRISYVLSGKNVITDSTGGGAIASVPQVLGTQIARIEEFGISFNPESFAAWGADVFFTDAKRGSVINIRGTEAGNDQIQIISQYGMRSWFRDQFSDQLHTQKIGGYDPYMNEYVLSSNKRSIPVPVVATACGTNLTQTNTTQTLSYTVNVGETVGDITIPYTISSGDITITATWNGVDYTATNVTANGTITIPKTANTPNTVDIVIDVNGSSPASYGITVDCPPQENLTIIRVVLSSPSTDGQFIHYDYNWTDGSTISPNVNSLASLGINTPTEYISQTGVRSVGSFPYTGADITMRSITQGFDDFVFDPLSDKFLILSSPTLYANTPAGMSALLAAGPSNVTPIFNVGVNYQATETAFAMPSANTYLYLIWDLREVTMSQLCFSPVLTGSSSDACCGCNPTCTVAWFGPNSGSSSDALLTDTNLSGSAQYSFNGSGQIPQVGEVCYENLTCDIQQYLTPGYYLVNLTAPSTLPKTWVEIGNYGAVIDAG